MSNIEIKQLSEKQYLQTMSRDVYKRQDHSCDNTTETKIRELVLQQQGVEGIDDLKTRMFEAKMYVDIEMCIRDRDIPIIGKRSIIKTYKQRGEEWDLFLTIKN